MSVALRRDEGRSRCAALGEGSHRRKVILVVGLVTGGQQIGVAAVTRPAERSLACVSLELVSCATCSGLLATRGLGPAGTEPLPIGRSGSHR